MATFDTAYLAFGIEANYCDSPEDPDAVTNYGWTVGALRMAGTQADSDFVRNLTAAQAKDLYEAHYWHKLWNDLHCQDAANKLLALNIMISAPQNFNLPVRCLQRACWAAGHYVLEDGVMGLSTLTAANACDPAALSASIRSEMAAYYRTQKAEYDLRVKHNLPVVINVYKNVRGWLHLSYC